MKWKRVLFAVLIFAVLSILENETGPVWNGCNPPYLLCGVILCAVFFGAGAGCCAGLVCGLLADVFSSHIFGFRAILFLILAYLTAFLADTVLSRSWFSCLLCGTVSSAVCECALWLAVSLRTPIPADDAFFYVIMPRTAMSVPVTLLLYLLFARISREREAVGRR